MIPARLQPIIDEAAPLAERFAAAGFTLYLVGGIVRDVLLGRELAGHLDIDITTDARPDDIEALVRRLGRRGVAAGPALRHRRLREGRRREFEITTFRAEVYRPDSRKPEVAFADDIETDLSRRDFTVNAMAIALPRAASSSTRSTALADLAAAAPAHAARRPRCRSSTTRCACCARRGSSRRSGSSPTPSWSPRSSSMRRPARDRERGADPRRAVEAAGRRRPVAPGLWFLADTGLADEFLPELNAMRLEQDPIHRHKDVLAHTIAVVAKTRAASCIVRLAALLHDVGQAARRAVRRRRA